MQSVFQLETSTGALTVHGQGEVGVLGPKFILAFKAGCGWGPIIEIGQAWKGTEEGSWGRVGQMGSGGEEG